MDVISMVYFLWFCLSLTCIFLMSWKLHWASLIFKMYSFLIEGSLLYNIVLASGTDQHESAIGIHTSPSSWTSLPPSTHPTLLDSYKAPIWVLWVIQQIPIGYLFYTWSCKFPWYSLHISHPLFPTFLPAPLPAPTPPCLCLFSMSVSLLLPCK